MSETSLPDSADDSDEAHEAAEAADPSDSASTTSTQNLPNWLTFAALGIALVAVGFSVIGWFLPRSTTDEFSAGQVTDAKKQICAASTSVLKAVVTNTHRANPNQGDPASALAVAANARLALYGGGAYLQGRLAKQPATPADLTKTVDSMANTLQQLGIGYLAGVPETAQQPLRDDLNVQIDQVKKLCK
jgi:hypothetical protein